MLWNESVNLTPQIGGEFSHSLDQFETDWYKIRLGYIFDPETSEIGTCVLYHVVNKMTGVIEFQGAYLPSCINNAKALTESMKELLSDDKDKPRITFN